jgi:hypothetical protein
MKPDHHRDNNWGEGPQRLFVRFDVAHPMAIPIEVAGIGNDWRRMASFRPNPFGGRTFNLQGPSSAGRRSSWPQGYSGISNAERP